MGILKFKGDVKEADAKSQKTSDTCYLTSDTNNIIIEGKEYGKGVTKEELESTYAKQEGEYPNLIAGHAKNLDGIKENINNSAYRPVAGNDDIKNGTGSIERIQGNSIAWNQLVNPNTSINDTFADVNLSYINGKFVLKGTSIASGGRNTLILAKNINLVQNHKYFALINKPNTDSVFYFFITEPDSKNVVLSNSVEHRIFTITENYTNSHIGINVENSRSYNWTGTYNLFDLTLIYGIGNEPTTPEQFEADYQRWFGRTLDYEEYDDGSIRTTLATGIKTVGFNLSNIDSFEGHSRDWYQNNERILWKNDCGYKGQIRCSMSVLSDVVDVGQQGKYAFPSIVIKYTDETTEATKNNTVDVNNVVFPYTGVVTSNPNKIIKEVRTTFSFWGTIKISNICINFVHSGIRNGDYEPHWEETKALPVTTLTGKLDGKGDSVVIFPDGLKRAGTICDEIYEENGVTKAVKRVGSVDLGTLTWELYHTKDNQPSYGDVDAYNFGAKFKEGKYTESYGIKANILCQNYNTTNIDAVYWHTSDKIIAYHAAVVRLTDDSANNDSAALKQKLQGCILYYELAEPKTYIVDNFELPAVYKVDDFGTEEIIQPVNSIAPTMTIKYGLNAVDTCRRLPERVNNIENLVEELKNANKDKETIIFTCSLNYKNAIAHTDASVRRLDPTNQVYYLVDSSTYANTVIPLTASALGSTDSIAFVGIYYPLNSAGVIKFVRFSCLKVNPNANGFSGTTIIGDLTPTWQTENSGNDDDDNYYYYGYALIGNFDENKPIATNNLDFSNAVEIKQ